MQKHKWDGAQRRKIPRMTTQTTTNEKTRENSLRVNVKWRSVLFFLGWHCERQMRSFDRMDVLQSEYQLFNFALAKEVDEGGQDKSDEMRKPNDGGAVHRNREGTSVADRPLALEQFRAIRIYRFPMRTFFWGEI